MADDSSKNPERFGLVTFTSYGEEPVRVPLTLDDGWKMEAGLKPNINRATVGHLEFDRFKGDLNRTGKVEFWFNAVPDEFLAAYSQPNPGPLDPDGNPRAAAEPDVTIEDVSIVDVEAVEIGRPYNLGDKGSIFDFARDDGRAEPVFPNQRVRVVLYRLYFADFRCNFIHPRGGRLRYGLLNPGEKVGATATSSLPPPSDGGVAAGNAEQSLPELIQLCTRAMGLGPNVPLPTNLNTFPAPRNLQWHGSHAPTELEKLLAKCRCVFTPRLDGTVRIFRADEGDRPEDTIPEAVRLAGLQVPGIDRRGKIVVVTSYPSAHAETMELSGSATTGWRFVTFNKDLKYDEIHKIDFGPVVTGAKPGQQIGAADIFKARFTNISGALQNGVASTLYRSLQLVGPDFPPDVKPVLRKVLERDGTLTEIRVRAKIAQQGPDGLWRNSAEFIDVPVIALDQTQNIIHLDRPLAQVAKDGTADPYGDFQEVPYTDIFVRFTTERARKDSLSGKWVKEFFEAGYTRDVGQTRELTQDELDNALEGRERAKDDGQRDSGDIVFLERPELRIITADHQSPDLDDLKKRARLLAEQAMKGSGVPVRTMMAIGFVPAEPSGLVNSVKWDQKATMTTLEVSNWSAPTSPGAERRDKDEAYPNAGATAGSRQALGETGSRDPIVPVGPGVPAGSGPGLAKPSKKYQVYTPIDDSLQPVWTSARFEDPS